MVDIAEHFYYELLINSPARSCRDDYLNRNGEGAGAVKMNADGSVTLLTGTGGLLPVAPAIGNADCQATGI
ncbi:MAG: hypothetical protein Q8S00_09615 [Deltaproteobacteria bacterium]|nr:hypothetical protein [Deltaproteobacteria bacterium]MDZ4347666.1 hypothetical protein [Candidatus Binatia bacterium]